MIGTGPTPRILDFANRNVGIGCGNVHIWDPEAANGTVNSGVTQAGILPVYGDRGGGAEINGKIEAGLLGITVSPDFMQTGHIYLQYFPTFNPDNPVHPGLADGDQRRITKMNKGRVTRFTVDLETKQLELDSEVVIFEYESQIYSCCHRGGGMGFDSEGNLYVTTGDSNSSQSTNGYSGNFQPARCPTGDPQPWRPTPTAATTTSPTTTRAGPRAAPTTTTARCCGSTPSTRSPTGRSRRSASTAPTRCRTRESPNGPNLFNGTEGNGNQAKPEIYAMGLRNPSRLFIDPETDIPYSAWVGPDAGSPSRDPGPVDVRERHAARAGRQLRLALLHGQPAGLPRPRRRRLAAHHQRGRLRDRRPRRRADAGLVRLQQHRQRLDEQHRPDRAAAHDRDRDGRRPRAAAQPLVQPRQPGRHQRLPELPARERREQRAELRRRDNPGRPRTRSSRSART